MGLNSLFESVGGVLWSSWLSLGCSIETKTDLGKLCGDLL